MNTILQTKESTPGTARDIRQLDGNEDTLWNEYLSGHPESNLYHTTHWRDLINRVFGHQAVYLYATNKGKISGVLPMFLIRFPGLGSKLISMPYDIGSGGVLSTDEQSECLLVEHALGLATSWNVNYFEMRYASKQPRLKRFQFQEHQPVVISEMVLDEEHLVWQRIEKDHRKAIRKSENRGVTVNIADSLDHYKEFFEIYLKVFRDFGTPPYGFDYFKNVWLTLQPSTTAHLLLARIDGRSVGGLLLYGWGRCLISKFAVCLPEAVPYRAYAALYWRAIQLGLDLGFTRLSWGTSSAAQSGLIDFKSRWGAQCRPAYLYSRPIRKGIPPIESYYDSSAPIRRLWTKLPLALTRIAGPYLNRWFC